mgnify:CR=1 FL=1
MLCTTSPMAGKILSGIMLWEAYLENADKFPGIERAREAAGTHEVRCRFLALIDAADEVFNHASAAGYGMGFDYDFAEDFLLLLTDAADADCESSAPALRIGRGEYATAGTLIAMRSRVMSARSAIERQLAALSERRGTEQAPPGVIWPPELDDWPTLPA